VDKRVYRVILAYLNNARAASAIAANIKRGAVRVLWRGVIYRPSYRAAL